MSKNKNYKIAQDNLQDSQNYPVITVSNSVGTNWFPSQTTYWSENNKYKITYVGYSGYVGQSGVAGPTGITGGYSGYIGYSGQSGYQGYQSVFTAPPIPKQAIFETNGKQHQHPHTNIFV